MQPGRSFRGHQVHCRVAGLEANSKVGLGPGVDSLTRLFLRNGVSGVAGWESLGENLVRITYFLQRQSYHHLPFPLQRLRIIQSLLQTIVLARHQ